MAPHVRNTTAVAMAPPPGLGALVPSVALGTLPKNGRRGYETQVSQDPWATTAPQDPYGSSAQQAPYTSMVTQIVGGATTVAQAPYTTTQTAVAPPPPATKTVTVPGAGPTVTEYVQGPGGQSYAAPVGPTKTVYAGGQPTTTIWGSNPAATTAYPPQAYGCGPGESSVPEIGDDPRTACSAANAAYQTSGNQWKGKKNKKRAKGQERHFETGTMQTKGSDGVTSKVPWTVGCSTSPLPSTTTVKPWTTMGPNSSPINLATNTAVPTQYATPNPNNPNEVCIETSTENQAPAKTAPGPARAVATAGRSVMSAGAAGLSMAGSMWSGATNAGKKAWNGYSQPTAQALPKGIPPISVTMTPSAPTMPRETASAPTSPVQANFGGGGGLKKKQSASKLRASQSSDNLLASGGGGNATMSATPGMNLNNFQQQQAPLVGPAPAPKKKSPPVKKHLGTPTTKLNPGNGWKKTVVTTGMSLAAQIGGAMPPPTMARR
jgi:hypothetical protein